MNSSIKNLIWIASYPKSGNTWFRILLKNLFSQTNNKEVFDQQESIPIASNRQIFDYYSGIHSSELSRNEIDNLRPKVFRCLSEDIEYIKFFKVHDCWRINNEGNSLFPHEVTKGVIYLIRNPLDIAVSLSFHNSCSYGKSVANINDQKYCLASSKDKLTIQIHQYLSSWSNHVSSWVYESDLPVHIIRYEDLLIDTYKEFTNALEFLGLYFDNELITNAISNSQFLNLQEQEKKEGFLEKPMKANVFFREGKSNIFMNYLSAKHIEAIYKCNKAIMNKFGYTLDIYL